MKTLRPASWAAAALAAGSLAASTAEAHSRRIAHGPTSPSFVTVAPPDGVSPRLVLRHRTAEGAAIEADPVTISATATGQPFATHLHGPPLLASQIRQTGAQRFGNATQRSCALWRRGRSRRSTGSS
jgi:hypothetical protein